MGVACGAQGNAALSDWVLARLSCNIVPFVRRRSGRREACNKKKKPVVFNFALFFSSRCCVITRRTSNPAKETHFRSRYDKFCNVIALIHIYVRSVCRCETEAIFTFYNFPKYFLICLEQFFVNLQNYSRVSYICSFCNNLSHL